MFRLTGLFRALVPAVLLMGYIMPASAQTTNSSVERTIAVTGTGTVAAVPDRALVQVGAVTAGANLQDALDANSAVVDRLIAGLKDVGLSERDIATTRFDVQPEYARGKENGNNPPVITGYRVTNMLQLKVSNLQIFGSVLDRAVQLGANQIGGVQLDVSRADQLKNEARQKAVAQAQERAQLYADAAGVKIARVLSIAELDGIAEPRPVPYARTASAVPIEAGERELGVTVQMVFVIE